jgi:hypothetical protein
MILTRSAALVIDTVVRLTLAKWETVSGRFGGYLTHKYRGRGLFYRLSPQRGGVQYTLIPLSFSKRTASVQSFISGSPLTLREVFNNMGQPDLR